MAELSYPLPPHLKGVSPESIGSLTAQGANIATDRARLMQQGQAEQARINLSAQSAANQLAMEQARLQQSAQQAAMRAAIAQDQAQKSFLLQQQRAEIGKAYQEQQINLAQQRIEATKIRVMEGSKLASAQFAAKQMLQMALAEAGNDPEKQRAAMLRFGVLAGVPTGVTKAMPAPERPDFEPRIMNVDGREFGTTSRHSGQWLKQDEIPKLKELPMEVSRDGKTVREKIPIAMVPETFRNLGPLRTNALNVAAIKLAGAQSRGDDKPKPKSNLNFDSVSDARRDGHDSGEVIKLWNPATGKYADFKLP